jgi:hypothetical protein
MRRFDSFLTRGAAVKPQFFRAVRMLAKKAPVRAAFLRKTLDFKRILQNFT